MALKEQLEKFKGFDVNELTLDNIGSAPLIFRGVLWVAVFAAVVAGSYYGVLVEKHAALAKEQRKEVELRGEFEKKVQDAANLELYRQQISEMNDSLSALLAQLPKDTEVPGLLDDISNKGQESGLSFDAIDLKQEKKADFYVELPIEIHVVGGYHDFGTFVSGVAGLPRIVTLHDFKIEAGGGAKGGKVATKAARGSGNDKGKDSAKDKDVPNDLLSMTILAKTYRYKSAEEAALVDKDKNKKAAVKGANAKGGKTAPAKK